MNNNNFKKGFTIVEMLVSVTIFSILIVAVLSLFVSILRAQRHAFTTNYLTDQASYSLEYIYKQVRDSYPEDLEVEDDSIKIVNKKGGAIIKLEEGRIKVGNSFLTPGDIEVKKLEVIDSDLKQSYKRLTILLEMTKDERELFLQQTISLRNPID